ncbi:hypothetical protein JG688_00017767, partial [Phytophthora aleatoria]
VTFEGGVTFKGGVASEGGVTSERHVTSEQRVAFGRGVAFEWSGLAAKSKMPRIRYEWEMLGEFNSSEAVSEFKSVGFCCSRVVHSDPACGCRVCEGSDHIMTEKRLRCVSRTCKVDGTCKYMWKIWICAAAKQWHVYHNTIDHIRGESVQCQGPHRVVISAEMKSLSYSKMSVPSLPCAFIVICVTRPIS